MPRTIYKICGKSEWELAERAGCYEGSSDDGRDGFIHLSAGHQVAGTLTRHFSGRGDLVLVSVHATALGPALLWEPSQRGETYPHCHGPLPLAAVVGVQPLPLGPDGTHILPDGVA